MCLLKHHDRLQGTSWFRRSQWTFVWNILRSDKMGYQEISCEWPLYPPKEQLRQSRVNTHDKVFNVDSQGTPGMVSSVGAHTQSVGSEHPQLACRAKHAWYIYFSRLGGTLYKNLQPTTYIDLKYACFFPDTCATSLGAAFDGDTGSFFTALRAATSDAGWCRWAEKVLMGINLYMPWIVDVLYLVGTRMALLAVTCVQPMIAYI